MDALTIDTMQEISFVYLGKEYKALIRSRPREGYMQHCITIMNGTLESLLFGQHIFAEKNGELIYSLPGNEIQAGLKEAVANGVRTALCMQSEKGFCTLE